MYWGILILDEVTSILRAGIGADDIESIHAVQIVAIGFIGLESHSGVQGEAIVY